MDREIIDGLGRLIMLELDSAYRYLHLSSWFEERRMVGFAQWMRNHAHAETHHALVLFRHMAERGVEVPLGKLDAAAPAVTIALEVIAQALDDERRVSACARELAALATSHHDNATRVLLNWFAGEQTEEEDELAQILVRLEMFGEDYIDTLNAIDEELAERNYPFPAALRA